MWLMIWQMRWLNRNVATTINVTLQLLNIDINETYLGIDLSI